LPGDRYEGWAEERREELRRVYLELLFEVAGTYEEHGAYERGIGALRTVVAEEPVLEEAHVALMRLYAHPGEAWAKVPLPAGRTLGLLLERAKLVLCAEDCVRLYVFYVGRAASY